MHVCESCVNRKRIQLSRVQEIKKVERLVKYPGPRGSPLSKKNRINLFSLKKSAPSTDNELRNSKQSREPLVEIVENLTLVHSADDRGDLIGCFFSIPVIGQ